MGDDLDWVDGVESSDEDQQKRLDDIDRADKAKLLLENADLRLYAGRVEERLEATEAKLEAIMVQCSGLFAELEIIQNATILAKDAAQQAQQEAEVAAQNATVGTPDYLAGQLESLKVIVECMRPDHEEHQRVLLVMAQDFYCSQNLSDVYQGNVNSTHSPFDQDVLIERDRRIMCEVMNIGMHVWRLERAFGFTGGLDDEHNSPRFMADSGSNWIGFEMCGNVENTLLEPDSWYNPHTGDSDNHRPINSKTGTDQKWWDHVYSNQGSWSWHYQFQAWADATVDFKINFGFPISATVS
jgi:hypothetical protein